MGVLIFAALFVLKPGGDTVLYEGKTLRAWALEAQAGDARALTLLSHLGTNALPGLVDLLGRKDSFVRRQATAFSLKLPRPLARLFSRWALRSDMVTYRCAAARALGTLGPGAEPAVPALTKALHDRDPQVSYTAASALSQIGPGAVPALLRGLSDPNPLVRSRAAYALGQIGSAAEPALPMLIQSFADTNQAVRESAIYAAGIIGNPAMLAISNVLDHGGPVPRDAAVKELLRFRRSLQVPVPALVKMAQAPDSASRQLALSALGALRVADNASMGAVTNALYDPDPQVRLAAVKALKAMIWRAHEALPQLIQKLQDGAPEVRQWTVSTLGDIGPRAGAAIPELVRVADTDPVLRPTIRQALPQIESPAPKP